MHARHFVFALLLACGDNKDPVTNRDAAPDVPEAGCDTMPTSTVTASYTLDFTVPTGLMPDAKFDGRQAQLEVHRVSPVYANGKCPGVETKAIVLIHGRTVAGDAAFDLRHPTPEGGVLSIQEALARAGIDTFAPSLLGYGRSTRFADGLDDPCNASLPAYEQDNTTCMTAAGCDRNFTPIFALDQQGTLLVGTALTARCPHTSSVRFARIDTWVRDIRQVIDDAIARAQPSDGKVVLLGYSAGGPRVARTLYTATDTDKAKISRVVFVSSIFGGVTEEPSPPPAPTFPLTLNTAAENALLWRMPTDAETACTGHLIAGSDGAMWTQMMASDSIGESWDLIRSPTFSSYGWNATVAATLTMPVLVMQGTADTGLAPPLLVESACGISKALPASSHVLVRLDCASHALPYEGCTGARCTPASGTPYGGSAGQPWAGPHATLKAALIEWATRGTFNGASTGSFLVESSGVLASTAPPCP